MYGLTSFITEPFVDPVTVTIAFSFNEEAIVNKVKKYLKKYSLKDTVDLILETEKISKKKVYQLCLEQKNEKDN